MKRNAWEERPIRTFLCVAAMVWTYLAPYSLFQGRWWRFLPATVAILLIGRLLTGRKTMAFFGLNVGLRAALVSLVAIVLGVPLCRSAIELAIHASGITADLAWRPWSHLHQLFQVLNDELVVRAALVGSLVRALGRPRTVVLGTAIAFAVGHSLFYQGQGVAVSWIALCTIGAFAVVANALYVGFGHIGYGFALHYAWNFFRFNTVYYRDGVPLSEGATFNYIEGDPALAIPTLLLSIAVFAWLSRVRLRPT